MQRIRVRLDADTRANVLRYTLEGTVYEFVFRRSGRTPESWFMDVRDAASTTLVAGIALVPGVELLRPFKHLAVPPGQLFAYDTSKTYLDPTPDEMDDRVVLLYRPSTDVVATAASGATVISIS